MVILYWSQGNPQNNPFRAVLLMFINVCGNLKNICCWQVGVGFNKECIASQIARVRFVKKIYLLSECLETIFRRALRGWFLCAPVRFKQEQFNN